MTYDDRCPTPGITNLIPQIRRYDRFTQLNRVFSCPTCQSQLSHPINRENRSPICKSVYRWQANRAIDGRQRNHKAANDETNCNCSGNDQLVAPDISRLSIHQGSKITVCFSPPDESVEYVMCYLRNRQQRRQHRPEHPKVPRCTE